MSRTDLIRPFLFLSCIALALWMALVSLSYATPAAAALQAATATSATPAATPIPINIKDFSGKVDTLISTFMATNHNVACAFAVVYPDSAGQLQTHISTYGTVSKQSKTPVAPASMFEIGSLSKLFAADLLAKYVQDGLMQLDDPLQKYLPATVHVPTFNGQEITLRELATHTSALPRNVGKSLGFATLNGAKVTGYLSDDDAFKFLNSYKLTRAPGSKWEYSNLAFGLLGVAEENIGKASFENLVLKWIAGPLGMHDTRATVLPAEKALQAQPYFAAGGNAPPFAPNGANIAAGGLRSSIQDMATYLAANIDPDSTTIAAILEQAQAKQYDSLPGMKRGLTQALAWGLVSPDTPQEILSKDGSTAGFNAYISIFKSWRAGYVVSCSGNNVPQGLVSNLNKIFGQAETTIDDADADTN